MKGKKTGGRQKGTPNLVRSRGGLVAAACDQVGVNPFLELATVAKNRKHENHTRANIELAGYLAPKLRAIEHTGVGGGPIEGKVIVEITYVDESAEQD